MIHQFKAFYCDAFLTHFLQDTVISKMKSDLFNDCGIKTTSVTGF